MGSYQFLDFQTQADGVGGEALTQYSEFSSFDGLAPTQDGPGAEGGGIMSGLDGAQQNGVPGAAPGRPSPVPSSAAASPGAAGAAGTATGATGSASGAANGSAGTGVEGLSAAMSEMSFDEGADEEAGEYQTAEAPEHACRSDHMGVLI